MNQLTKLAISPEEQAAINQAQMAGIKMMQDVSAAMREVPVLPSEVPQDVHNLKEVVFPENGVLTYMHGLDYPYKGFPLAEFVEKIDTIKKVQRGILSSLFHTLKRRKWKLILFPWLLTDLAVSCIHAFHRVVSRFKVKTSKYSDAIRELDRAFSVEWADESPESRQARFELKDVVCTLLEFDNAYRYRFQDVIVELDKVALKQNPSKEILRLVGIMTRRERRQEVKDTWSLITFFLPVFLFFNRSLRRQLVGVLSRIDLEKVKLSPEDKYFCARRVDYTFGTPKSDPVFKEAFLLQDLEEDIGKIRKVATAQTNKIIARHQKELEAITLTPEQKVVAENDVPGLLQKNNEEYNLTVTQLVTQLEHQRKQNEEKILALLPEPLRELRKRHHEERVALDKKNEKLLIKRQRAYEKAKKKLKENVSSRLLHK